MSLEQQIKAYSQAFEWKSLFSVYQFLRKFKWNEEATQIFYEMLYPRKVRRAMERTEQKAAREADGLNKETVVEPRKLSLIVGTCPRCGAWVRAMELPGCEARKTGRYLIKECESCPYYSELMYKNNKLVEIEGE